MLSPELEACLGDDEVRILVAVGQGCVDMESIHVVTGIPIHCVERKLGALIEIGFITEGSDGYKIGGIIAMQAPPLQDKDFHRSTREGAAKREKRVLVVDDEPDIRLLIRMVLERHGYVVLEASNGQKALDVLESQGKGGVTCVITDYLMPHMNGLQLCDELRKHPEVQYTIFLMTAYLDRASFDATRCFDEKFMKPLDFGELVSRLASHVA